MGAGGEPASRPRRTRITHAPRPAPRPAEQTKKGICQVPGCSYSLYKLRDYYKARGCWASRVPRVQRIAPYKMAAAARPTPALALA